VDEADFYRSAGRCQAHCCRRFPFSMPLVAKTDGCCVILIDQRERSSQKKKTKKTKEQKRTEKRKEKNDRENKKKKRRERNDFQKLHTKLFLSLNHLHSIYPSDKYGLHRSLTHKPDLII
jgi:hypothetical protein